MIGLPQLSESFRHSRPASRPERTTMKIMPPLDSPKPPPPLLPPPLFDKLTLYCLSYPSLETGQLESY